MTTLTSRCLTIPACAVMTMMVSVGCTGSTGGGTGSASPPPTASKSGTSGPPTRPVPASVRPSAKDGTNYKACLGGNCEIAVSKRVKITLADSPLDIDAGPFTVEKVNAKNIEVSMAFPSGPSLGTTIKKGCSTTFYGNNASGWAITSCTKEPEEILGMYIQQTVTVKDITGGTAILRLKSG